MSSHPIRPALAAIAAAVSPGRDPRRSEHAMPAGACLVHQGDDAREVIYLAQGLVKLVATRRSGAEAIVALRGDRSWLGSESAILGRAHAYSIHAVTPCRVRILGVTAFRAHLSRKPHLAWALLRQQSRDLRAQGRDLTELGCLGARARLLRFFRRLPQMPGMPESASSTRIELPLRHWEIAQLLGMTPPYLSQLIAQLEREGRLRRERGSILLEARPGKNK